jgi:acyl carrier protein
MMIDLGDVRRTVGLVLGCRDPDADARIEADLGAESMDVLNLVATLEEKYGVPIDEAARAGVSTVRDLYNLLLRSSDASVPPADPAG